MKKLMLLIMLFTVAIVTSAQEDVSTYASHDGAVTFQYDADWELESQSYEFNQQYSYQLMNPPRTAMSLYIPSDEQGTIYVDIFNTPDDLDLTPEDHLQAYFGNGYDLLEETTIQGFPAIIAEIPTGEATSYMQVYAIDRDDGWAIVAGFVTPIEQQESSAEAVEAVLESINFDVTLAETPFVRNLEDYDFSDAELAESHMSDMGSISLDYPETWEIERSEPFGEPAVAHFVIFSLPDDNLNATVVVFNAADDRYGLPLSQNSAYEYMVAQRQNDDIREFRIGTHDAVAIDSSENETLTISYEVDEIHVAQGIIEGGDEDARSAYEAELVALLDSLQFTFIEEKIYIPALNAPVPSGWTMTQQSFRHNNYYQIYIEQNDYSASEPAIFIFLVNLENDADFAAHIASNGLTGAIFDPYVMTGTPEILTIGDYEITRVPIETTDGFSKGNASLFYPQDGWFGMIATFTYDEAELPSLIPYVDTILELTDFEE